MRRADPVCRCRHEGDVFVCVRVCVHVFACVCVRERERERESMASKEPAYSEGVLCDAALRAFVFPTTRGLLCPGTPKRGASREVSMHKHTPHTQTHTHTQKRTHAQAHKYVSHSARPAPVKARVAATWPVALAQSWAGWEPCPALPCPGHGGTHAQA